MTDTHVHRIQRRWADLDQLNHVNNVQIQEYAAEARELLIDEGVLDATARPSHSTVTFLLPLVLGRRPVEVVSRLDGQVLSQDVTTRDGDARTVHASVVMTYGPRTAALPANVAVDGFDLWVRRSDRATDGTVTPVKIAEYFQEGRVLQVSDAFTGAGAFVIARAEVTYAQDFGWRREPYGVRSWFERLGTASAVVRSELVDGDVLLATGLTVLVGFDAVTQTSRRFDARERAAVTAGLRSGPPVTTAESS